jgi:ABC-type dipeptide/oligopeptide/nickel transport system permease subunit
VALVLTVLAFNLAGDWLTDLLDPETSGDRR